MLTGATETAPQETGPLTLEKLVTLTLENHPELASAYARVEMAHGEMIQAGLYPNPMVAWSAEEVGERTNAAGFQGVMLSQQIVLGDKLQLAQAAAAYGITVANWQAITKRYDLITRVRTAYFEALTAQRELETTEKIVQLAEENLKVAQFAQRAGIGARPDVLRAEIELEQSRIRRVVSQQRVEAAWKLLATAVGMPKLPRQELQGSLEDTAPAFDWHQTLGTVLMRSSEVQSAQAVILQAQQKLRRQQAQPIPDLYLQFVPMYDFPDKVAMTNIQAGVNLPIFNKNQGNILTAQAEVVNADLEARQVELKLTERLTQAFQRFEAARRQVEIYQKEIVPKAAESLKLVRQGYQTGDAKFDYTTVLQAQQTLAQAELATIQVLGELWRAVTDIAGLLQQETLAPGKAAVPSKE